MSDKIPTTSVEGVMSTLGAHAVGPLADIAETGTPRTRGVMSVGELRLAVLALENHAGQRRRMASGRQYAGDGMARRRHELREEARSAETLAARLEELANRLSGK